MRARIGLKSGMMVLALAAVPSAALAKKAKKAASTPPVVVTPPAVAKAAAAPAPLAITATNATLDNLTVSQAFPAYQSTVKYQVRNATGVPEGFGNHARATTTIRYDAATQSYIIRDTGSTAITSTFAPADKVPAESDATYTVYRKVGSGTTETFRLLNPGAANPLIALTYTSFGAWRRSTPGAATTAVNDTYFVYGIKTAGADVPRTGTGTYTAALDGSFENRTAVYALSGTGSFLADFAAGTIGFSATPVGTPGAGAPLAFGTINGSGPISFKNASFKANGTNGSYAMDIAGYFFGPAAAEIGGTFRLNGGNGNGNGAIVGKQ